MHPVPPIPDDLPDAARRMVLAYDGELDELHAGWRQREPFGALPLGHLARVKWLLKRRELLLFRVGSEESSRPAPRDWTVKIVPSPSDPRQCFAVPVDPATVAPALREITTEPPRVSL